MIDLSSHKNGLRQKFEREVAPTESATSAADDKKKTKCRFFPNCKDSEDVCPYFHPKEECKFFPTCQFGEKCLYIHQDVRSF